MKTVTFDLNPDFTIWILLWRAGTAGGCQVYTDRAKAHDAFDNLNEDCRENATLSRHWWPK